MPQSQSLLSQVILLDNKIKEQNNEYRDVAIPFKSGHTVGFFLKNFRDSNFELLSQSLLSQVILLD